MQDNKRLSSTEISNLWTHYIRETMAVCVSNYMLKIINDNEITDIYKIALKMSQRHVKFLREIFIQEEFPIPKGFSEDGVDINTPPLFTDKYCLLYILTMSMHGMQGFSIALSVSFRRDIRDFYYQCNLDSMDLYNKSVDVAYAKKYIEMPPYYSQPENVKFIESFDYVTDVFGKQRTMNSIEGGNVFINLQKSIVAKAFFLAGQQVCRDKGIAAFLEKCIKTANNHLEIFTKLLMKENLNTGHTLDTEITNSTISPFSDKLFLYHTGIFFAAATSYYGTAAVASMRADLSIFCEKAIVGDLLIMGAFGKLMIDNGWAEQPPFACDRSNFQ